MPNDVYQSQVYNSLLAKELIAKSIRQKHHHCLPHLVLTVQAWPNELFYRVRAMEG
jgi:hypothetical protein